MSEPTSRPTVGALPDTAASSSYVPVVLTRLVWLLFLGSLGVLVARLRFDGAWTVPGLLAVDGLTVVMWVVVAFLSGVVHSYSRRYMAGEARETGFFGATFGFTVTVMGLVAADHLALFGVLWLAMGLLMAELVGTARGWTQARRAAGVARRYFLASSVLLGVALAALWSETGATTVSGVGATADALGGPVWLVAACALVLAAMIQSALLPFHTWLLSSMTAPTPASALMHAGFVNAGGVLLARFAPVVTVDAWLMLVVVALGAASAVGGKLMKSVQTDVKARLGCSTVGQMGFMIMQAGLGFFGAAITHLILHGFYKAYQFLGSGGQVERTGPADPTAPTTTGRARVAGVVTALLTGVAGGVLFAAVTGKGLRVDSGLLLTFFVVFTVLHASWFTVGRTALPAVTRYVAVPLVFFPAIAVYAAVYQAVLALLPVAPVGADLTVFHVAIAAVFAGAYTLAETGVHERSRRLYVALLNAGQPAPDTLLTSTEEYNES